MIVCFLSVVVLAFAPLGMAASGQGKSGRGGQASAVSQLGFFDGPRGD
jgi:hypothetical protein